jgi:hypothetical protein
MNELDLHRQQAKRCCLQRRARHRSHFGRIFFVTTMARSVRKLEFVMNNRVTAGPPVRRRLALIVAGAAALFGSLFVAAPAQAGYYDAGYDPCYDRCGYPSYRYYRPYRPVYRHRCYSCGGSRLIYERRYIERELIVRRYGYGGFRRHYGYSPCGYRRDYGCSPYGYRRSYGYPRYGAYRGYSRPYGFGGVGRRWSLPAVEGYDRSGYYEPPRPPAPVSYEGDYY